MENILNRILSEIKGLKQGQESTNARLDRMGEQFDRIDERLDGIDKQFGSMDERLDGMDKRFDSMDERLDGMDKRFDHIDGRLDKMDKKLNAVYEQTADLTEFKTEAIIKLNAFENKIDNIENKLNDIEACNTARHTEITSELTKLKKDFTIMEAVTGKNMTDIAHLKSIK